MQTESQKPDKEQLTLFERWLELTTVVFMLLLYRFLTNHQSAGTGFFTPEFGPLEMLCLYGPIFVALIAPLIRAAGGRRNPARPFEATASLFLAVGSLWLWIVFPFDFTHLADTLPGSFRFLLAWFPDLLGKILLIIQVLTGPISAARAIWQYFSFRREESTQPTLYRGT